MDRHRPALAYASFSDPFLLPLQVATIGQSAMATERCEAYTPSGDQEREQRYLRYYGRPMPLMSKLMLSLQDDPRQANEFLRDHLAKGVQNASMRQLQQSLPARDESDATKPVRNMTYFGMKADLADKPRYGTTAHFLKECS